MPYRLNHFFARNWARTTIIGIVLFFLFYLLAAVNYPGGSNFNTKEIGYHFASNYWCELLGDYAKNGTQNTSRPYGMIGMFLLALAVGNFWYFSANRIPLPNQLAAILRLTGIFSMVCSLFIFNYLHDAFIALAVVFGLVAFGLLCFGLYKLGKKGHLLCGLTSILLILTNCIIYMKNIMIHFLPAIQKVTFLFVLLWIIAVTVLLNRTKNKSSYS